MRGQCVFVAVLLSAAGSALGHGEMPSDRPPAGIAAAAHRTVGGVTVAMPPPDGMSCDGLRAALQSLDRADYRRGRLLDRDHPDYPLFVYEDRVAAMLFFDCTLPEMQREPPPDLFSKGFGRE